MGMEMELEVAEDGARKGGPGPDYQTGGHNSQCRQMGERGTSATVNWGNGQQLSSHWDQRQETMDPEGTEGWGPAKTAVSSLDPAPTALIDIIISPCRRDTLHLG